MDQNTRFTMQLVENKMPALVFMKRFSRKAEWYANAKFQESGLLSDNKGLKFTCRDFTELTYSQASRSFQSCLLPKNNAEKIHFSYTSMSSTYDGSAETPSLRVWWIRKTPVRPLEARLVVSNQSKSEISIL